VEDECVVLQCNLALERILSLNHVDAHKRSYSIFRIERQYNFDTDHVDVPLHSDSIIYDDNEHYFVDCHSPHSSVPKHRIELYSGESTISYLFTNSRDHFNIRQVLLGREKIAE
jgi:hypothetical protein